MFLKTLLYLFGLGDNPISSPFQSDDAEKIRQDWENVGRDIYAASKKYGEQGFFPDLRFINASISKEKTRHGRGLTVPANKTEPLRINAQQLFLSPTPSQV